MFEIWLGVTLALYGIGLLVAIIGAFELHDYADSEDWKKYRAVVALGIVTFWLWPLVLICVLPAFVGWGLFNAVQLFKEWRVDRAQ